MKDVLENKVVIEIEALDPKETLQRIQNGLLSLVMGTLMSGSEGEDLILDRDMSNGCIEALSLVQATISYEQGLEVASTREVVCLVMDVIENPLEGIEEAANWPVLEN